jgi:xanthine/uracil permease
MKQPTILASVFQLIGSVLLIAALVPRLRGGSISVALLAPALVFTMLGLIFALRNRKLSKAPPAA